MPPRPTARPHGGSPTVSAVIAPALPRGGPHPRQSAQGPPAPTNCAAAFCMWHTGHTLVESGRAEGARAGEALGGRGTGA
ncbi:MAG: hypothetical protein ACRD0D_02280, partial [Acidimicrobiales bacterium]